MAYYEFDKRPAENIPRGTLLTLLVIPAGIIAWVLLWNVGFIASIVAWGVAWLAVRLYRFGSGGEITRTGAIRITIITIVTLVLALFAGLVSGEVPAYADHFGQTVVSALTDGDFWSYFWSFFPQIVGENGLSIVVALAFGALGCFNTLRGAFRASAPAQAQQRVMPEPLFPPRNTSNEPPQYGERNEPPTS